MAHTICVFSLLKKCGQKCSRALLNVICEQILRCSQDELGAFLPRFSTDHLGPITMLSLCYMHDIKAHVKTTTKMNTSATLCSHQLTILIVTILVLIALSILSSEIDRWCYLLFVLA